jgi:hypothetical protein
MRSFEILKALSAHKYTGYQILPTTDMREFEIHCGSIEKNRWYIFCENPQLGLADACGLFRHNSKMFYAYIIED